MFSPNFEKKSVQIGARDRLEEIELAQLLSIAAVTTLGKAQQTGQ
jgi:hypothetical protein